MSNRRKFVKNTVIAGLGTSFLMSSDLSWADSPNETVNLAIIGTGGRSYSIAQSIALCTNVKLALICDVDQIRLQEFEKYAKEMLGYTPPSEKDFRKVLDNKDIDAILVATPEHWHAPMAIMGMQAGKHVYVEKPCSHNLFENDLLQKAYIKYEKVCQMGSQQRSSVSSQKAIADIKDGIIGDVYSAKAWYANTRGTIGTGKKISVPTTLDWDLWQGPAPREDYKDNVHPYNWHWFKTWGTGEIHNNGTHEIDICRWALGVDFPKRVGSTGGRFHFDDDWQYYDTQNVKYEFDGGKVISWEGRSCNGMNIHKRSRGTVINGTLGSIILDREGYQLLDLAGKDISYTAEQNTGTSSSTQDTRGFDGLTVRHLQNFVDTIRGKEKLNAPIDNASISTHLCHLGNIAQEVNASLEVDSKNGQILNNKKALELTKRSYDKGWEPTL